MQGTHLKTHLPIHWPTHTCEGVQSLKWNNSWTNWDNLILFKELQSVETRVVLGGDVKYNTVVKRLHSKNTKNLLLSLPR